MLSLINASIPIAQFDYKVTKKKGNAHYYKQNVSIV